MAGCDRRVGLIDINSVGNAGCRDCRGCRCAQAKGWAEDAFGECGTRAGECSKRLSKTLSKAAQEGGGAAETDRAKHAV